MFLFPQQQPRVRVTEATSTGWIHVEQLIPGRGWVTVEFSRELAEVITAFKGAL